MTREHIPPRAAGNDAEITTLRTSALAANIADVQRWPSGHTVDTLCLPCNNRPGSGAWNYVKTYVTWRKVVMKAAEQEMKQTGRDPYTRDYPLEFDAPHTLQPARFARQVLGMLLAIQESEHLWADHPTVRSAVAPGDDPRGKPPTEVPPLEGIRLGMSLYNGDIVYNAKPVTVVEVPLGSTPLELPPGSGSSAYDLYALGVSPFLFMLTTHPSESIGLEITDWPSRRIHDGLPARERRLSIPTYSQLPAATRTMLQPTI
jgi:hypothetical protein